MATSPSSNTNTNPSNSTGINPNPNISNSSPSPIEDLAVQPNADPQGEVIPLPAVGTASIYTPSLLMSVSGTYAIFRDDSNGITAICSSLNQGYRQCAGMVTTDNPTIVTDLATGMAYVETKAAFVDAQDNWVTEYTGMDGSTLYRINNGDGHGFSVSVLSDGTLLWQAGITFNQENDSFFAAGQITDGAGVAHRLMGVGVDAGDISTVSYGVASFISP